MENENIISDNLLEVLACPSCRENIELVEYKQKTFGLECAKCECIYPIKEGIPIMLIDEAIKKKDLN